MYIPIEWLKNKENEKEIHKLLEESGGCFQFGDGSKKVEAKLNELGEIKILEEFEKGTFAK